MEKGMRVGYCRVSTEEQNLDRQEALMQELGVEKIFMEKASGKNSTNRPELRKALDFVRKGDILIVSEVSRLARNTRDLLEIVSILEEKNVRFISQKEGIDTETPQGKFMLTVFGALAELELNYIHQRQLEGIEIAKQMARLYPDWKSGKITARAFMKELGLQPATFYRRLREYENDTVQLDFSVTGIEDK